MLRASSSQFLVLVYAATHASCSGQPPPLEPITEPLSTCGLWLSTFCLLSLPTYLLGSRHGLTPDYAQGVILQCPFDGTSYPLSCTHSISSGRVYRPSDLIQLRLGVTPLRVRALILALPGLSAQVAGHPATLGARTWARSDDGGLDRAHWGSAPGAPGEGRPRMYGMLKGRSLRATIPPPPGGPRLGA